MEEKAVVEKCGGCGKDIHHMDKDIIAIHKGDFMDSDGLLQGFETIWIGHRNCLIFSLDDLKKKLESE